MKEFEYVTRADLQAFKRDLSIMIREAVREVVQPPQRRWLKTYEVRKMPGNISANTLQSMRDKGVLPHTMLNGLALYEYDKVVKLMEGLKQ